MRWRLPWSCNDLDPAERVRPGGPPGLGTGRGSRAWRQRVRCLAGDHRPPPGPRRPADHQEPGRHDADAWRHAAARHRVPDRRARRRGACRRARRAGRARAIARRRDVDLRRIRGGAAALGVPPAARPGGGGHGRGVTGEHELPVVSEPIFKYRLVVVGPGETPGPGGGTGHPRPRGPARQWRWLVDPSGTDAGSDTARLLRRLGVAEGDIAVFQSQTAALAAAADGAGVAPAIEHLVSHQLRRGGLSLIDLPGFPVEECWYVTLLERERRSTAASALRRVLGTPEAMQVMRSPAAGVPPSRFKPPVYVTIWS